jgi:hypothetical protein
MLDSYKWRHSIWKKKRVITTVLSNRKRVWFTTVWIRVYNGISITDEGRGLHLAKETLETVDDEDLAMRILSGTDNLPWHKRLTSTSL